MQQGGRVGGIVKEVCLPYISEPKMLKKDAEKEHRLFCPAFRKETISQLRDPSSTKKNLILVSFSWK